MTEFYNPCFGAGYLFAKLNRMMIPCALSSLNITNSEVNNMENAEKTIDKTTELLTTELETMTANELHEFFMFFYRMNHSYNNMITQDKFLEFLKAFESNPFKFTENKQFKKELIDNVITYTYDRMSLITAAVLLKKKFTLDEICQNYYSNVNAFGNDLF